MNDRIKVFQDGIVFVEYGPMRMRISVFDQGKSLPEVAQEGGLLAIQVLQDLAQFLPVIKKKAHEVEMEEALPDVVRRMLEATNLMGEPDLTPLAAVAGAASDVVADFLVSRGGTKIIVDNGGDIAIRLREGEVARVGIKTEINAKNPSFVLPIDATMRIEGVATSGFGGRSFTKGIASAVAVLSENASLADAAATVIANHTDVKDPCIKRALAETIYPDTDIAGEWVTIGVGKLSQKKIKKALECGLRKAYSILERGLIKGALITIKGQLVMTDSLQSCLIKL